MNQTWWTLKHLVMVRTLQKTFCLKQTRIVGEEGDIPTSTIKAILLMTSGTWMNQGSLLKLSRYWFSKENLKGVKAVRNQKSTLL